VAGTRSCGEDAVLRNHVDIVLLLAAVAVACYSTVLAACFAVAGIGIAADAVNTGSAANAGGRRMDLLHLRTARVMARGGGKGWIDDKA